MLRAKFYCNEIEENGSSEVVKLLAVYGNSDKDNEENNQFAEATPSGNLEMHISNTSAKGFFKQGEEYYLDFSKAEN